MQENFGVGAPVMGIHCVVVEEIYEVIWTDIESE